MTARYRMERNPDSGKNGNKMPLHPRLIPYETVSIKKLMKYAKSPPPIRRPTLPAPCS